MNCLVLDPKTVIVEASEVHQQEQMDKLGMNVIPCDLRDAYPFGGGLHCSTADVYREGECLDYFPNRPPARYRFLCMPLPVSSQIHWSQMQQPEFHSLSQLQAVPGRNPYHLLKYKEHPDSPQ